jgi:eukaryotic-like serine/threonine-protein kinase
MLEDRLVGQHVKQFIIQQHLGKGPVAHVYLGKHLHLDTDMLVIIKVWNEPFSPTAFIAVQQRLQEIAQLNHPGILQIIDQDLLGERLCVVMNHDHRSITLRQHFPYGLPVPPQRILPVIEQITEILHDCHQQGIFHLGIKPENIFINPENHIFLRDFCLSLEQQQQARKEENNGWAYVAPEQRQNAAGPASDQYALGMVSYEWLCGTSFSPKGVAGLLPPAAEAAIQRACHPNPLERFPSLTEFIHAMRDAYQSSPNSMQEGKTTNQQHISRRRLLYGGVAGLGAIAAGTGSVWWWTTQRVKQSSLPNIYGYVGEVLDTYNGHKNAGVYTVNWSPDGTRVASVGSDKVAHIWSVAPSAHNAMTYSHKQTAFWSPENGLVASFTDQEQTEIWEASTGKRVSLIGESNQSTFPLFWQQGTMKLWTCGSTYDYDIGQGDEKTLCVWNIPSGQPGLSPLWKRIGLTNWAISFDGLLFASIQFETTTSTNGSIHINQKISIESLMKKETVLNALIDLKNQGGQIAGLAWSPTGKHIAIETDAGYLVVLETTTGKLVFTNTDFKGKVGHVVNLSFANKLLFSPDEDHLAWIVQKSVAVIEVASGKTVYTYQEHQDFVNDICWAPDSKRIASCGAFNDNMVHIWQAAK